MKRKICTLAGILLYIGLGLTAFAQDAVTVLDTPEVQAEMEKARNLAGDDTYLLITQRLQSRDLDENGVPTQPPGVKTDGSETYTEPTRVLDNLYYVGGQESGSWIFTTSEGYIMVDAGYSYSPESLIIPGMKKLGLDPAKIRYILITHAGPDHVGGAKYFQDNYGSHIVMSAQDWETSARPESAGDRRERPANARPSDKGGDTTARKARGTGRERGRPEKNRPSGEGSRPAMAMTMPKQDIVGTDGQTLTLGDTTVTIVHTPRRVNGGGLSYIIPVFDNGEPHMWATYGNTNVVGTLEDKQVYRDAVAHFLTYTDAAKVDVVTSSHPFVDGSLERMEELRNRKPGEPNPFVVGQDYARRFFTLLDQCAVVSIARTQAGLDETGTKRLE